MTPERYERLCELFDQAQARPADQRATFLNEVGAADPTLCAELESMLADDQKAQDERLFQGPCPVNARDFLPGQQPTVLRAPPAGPDADDEPPEVEGYRLDGGQLGAGGMGVVWLGRDTRLHRAVAVKVLRHALRGRPQLERRFVEEAQVASQLAHPAIPPVHELGTLPDGRPYFVMKLVKGRTLADLLDARAGPADDLPRLLGIFEQVCQGMAYAHSKGVIHRDLKPSNIMVGAFGEVQVMDWGLAKVLKPGGGAEEARPRPAASVVRTVRSGSDTSGQWGSRTQAGAVLGTPAYMAPEQARGEVEALDERCDVFGLGAILCHVLTGSPPFGGSADGAMARARAGAVADAVMRLDGCGADAELLALAKGCLAPEPAGRPRDGTAVAAAVAAYLESVRERLRRAELERAAAEARAAEEARTRQVAEAKARVERRARRLAVGLAAAVLGLVAVGAGGGLVAQHLAAGRRADQARHDEELRQTVESALEKAAGLRQQARWGEAQAVLGQARQGLGDAGPDDLRRRLDGAEAELKLVNRLDAVRQSRAIIGQGGFDKRAAARGYAAAFREVGLGAVGDDPEAVAARVRTSGVSGLLVAALDDWAWADEEPGSEAWVLGVARRADPHPWGDRFRDPAVRRDRQALRALADDVLRDGGAGPGELSPHVLESLGRLLGGGAEAVPLLRAAQRRYPGDFWLSLALGNALYRAKQGAEAVGYYRAAVALRPDAPAAHIDLGNALQARPDLSGAIAEYRQAIELDPKFAPAHYNLGNALRDKGDVDGAVAEFRQTLALDPNFAPAHINLGLILGARGDFDGAIAEYQKAATLEPHDADTHASLGNALYAKGDLDGAVAELRQAIQLDPKLVPAHFNLGITLHARKDLAGAVAEHLQAIALAPKFPVAHAALGEALMRRGQFAEARTATRRCLDLLPQGDPLRPIVARQLDQCERLVAVDEKLPAFLAGEAWPADAAECLALGQVCGAGRRFHAAAARFHADAFAADPQLAADLKQQHRYYAACGAALAAAGQAEDAHHLPDKAACLLRRQALAWLRADLALHARQAEGDDPGERGAARRALWRWRQDPDLAPLRDGEALDRLPDDERRAWRQLWEDVGRLLHKVDARP